MLLWSQKGQIRRIFLFPFFENPFLLCKKQRITTHCLTCLKDYYFLISAVFCTVKWSLLHTCFSSISSTVSLSLPSPHTFPFFVHVAQPFPPLFPTSALLCPPSFSAFFCKVVRTPVLCGFWVLWSPLVTSSGATTDGWSSRRWAWYCCCSCWASSSTQSQATLSRRCWGPDALVASVPLLTVFDGFSYLYYTFFLVPYLFLPISCFTSRKVFIVTILSVFCAIKYHDSSYVRLTDKMQTFEINPVLNWLNLLKQFMQMQFYKSLHHCRFHITLLFWFILLQYWRCPRIYGKVPQLAAAAVCSYNF